MRNPPLVLVVDDEADLLEISKTKLEASGFQVDTAIDAEMAYDKARKIKPDLVLMDIRMPGINGTEALLDFKNDPELKGIKIAFLTSLVTPWPGMAGDNEVVAKELGAVTFFDKTKDLDDIEKLKAKILGELKRDKIEEGIAKELDKIKP